MARKSKTLKLISRRLKITRRGKILRRTMGQGHNKAKMTGNSTRSKRKWQNASGNPDIQKAIERMYQIR